MEILFNKEQEVFSNNRARLNNNKRLEIQLLGFLINKIKGYFQINNNCLNHHNKLIPVLLLHLIIKILVMDSFRSKQLKFNRINKIIFLPQEYKIVIKQEGFLVHNNSNNLKVCQMEFLVIIYLELINSKQD